MRIKFNKEVEFIIKRFFLPEKYLLKKRLKRAIKNNYENELIILERYFFLSQSFQILILFNALFLNKFASLIYLLTISVDL